MAFSYIPIIFVVKAFSSLPFPVFVFRFPSNFSSLPSPRLHQQRPNPLSYVILSIDTSSLEDPHARVKCTLWTPNIVRQCVMPNSYLLFLIYSMFDGSFILHVQLPGFCRGRSDRMNRILDAVRNHNVTEAVCTCLLKYFQFS